MVWMTSSIKGLSFLQLVSQLSYYFRNLWNLYRVESNWKNDTILGEELEVSCLVLFPVLCISLDHQDVNNQPPMAGAVMFS